MWETQVFGFSQNDRDNNVLNSTMVSFGQRAIAPEEEGQDTAAVLSDRWSGHRLGSTRLVGMFCLWTMVFWAVRSIGILLGDYDAEFTLVHVLLAVVSVGVALPVYFLDRVVGSLQRSSISDHPGRPVDH